MSAKRKHMWEQRGDKLCLWTEEGLTLWRLPIKLNDIHPDLLFLVECLLNYSYYEKEVMENLAAYKFTRVQGKHPGLCFSGGVDSLAAKILMPDDTRLVFHNRVLQIPCNNSYGLAKNIFDKMDREVYVVDSNSDVFRMTHGDGCGYSSTFCCGLGVILLADYLDLGYFATGMVLDSAYISQTGIKFAPLKDEIEFIWMDIFRRIGLPFYFPTAGIGEPVTNKICKEAGLLDLAVSCFRGTNCGLCIKCYRKLLLENTPPAMTPKIQKILDREILDHYAVYTYYSLQNNLKWDRYLDGDFSWLDQYYPTSFELIPDEFKDFHKEQLEKYARPMKQPYLIEQIDLANGQYPRTSFEKGFEL